MGTAGRIAKECWQEKQHRRNRHGRGREEYYII